MADAGWRIVDVVVVVVVVVGVVPLRLLPFAVVFELLLICKMSE